MDLAKVSLVRVRSLREQQMISQAELDTAEATLKQSQANADAIRATIEKKIIRAPFAGIVVSKDAQRGEMVSPISAGGGFTRTGIATLVDMNSLEIEVDVNESYIARVRPGQAVRAVLDAYPDWHDNVII